MELKKYQEILISPGASSKQYWRDIWAYRELFVFLAWRDVLVRYKQTVIGILWCIIKPVVTMLVFTALFGNLARLPANGIPYPVLVFTALLPWQFFAGALTDSSNSLIANANLLAKVYFPRFIIPVSSIMVSLVDFLVSFVILLFLLGYYQMLPSWRIICLPAFMVLAIFTALGLGLWFASLNVAYRDFRFIVPFMVQFGLFVSPVGFSSTIIPENLRLLYALNPLVAIIDGFRWSVIANAQGLQVTEIIISGAVSLTLLLSGIWFFRRTERSFVDVI
jgi:lipopolysaccharide transport system permease protein